MLYVVIVLLKVALFTIIAGQRKKLFLQINITYNLSLQLLYSFASTVA